jgi:hypothetical protein
MGLAIKKLSRSLTEVLHMDNEMNPKLEALIQQELRKLPSRRAPETLAPRVLAAIQAREQQSWWQRPWTTWPFKFRLIFMVAAVCSAILFLSLSFAVLNGNITNPLNLKLGQGLGFLVPFWEVLKTLGNAAILLTRSINQPFLLALSSLVFMMYLTCVAIGTACCRVAFNKL